MQCDIYCRLSAAGAEIERGRLDRAAAMEGVLVFHAGTKRLEHLTLSTGGRVLGVTALGEDIADAQRRAYAAVEEIRFENAYWRRDIANKAILARSPAP